MYPKQVSCCTIRNVFMTAQTLKKIAKLGLQKNNVSFAAKFLRLAGQW